MHEKTEFEMFLDAATLACLALMEALREMLRAEKGAVPPIGTVLLANAERKAASANSMMASVIMIAVDERAGRSVPRVTRRREKPVVEVPEPTAEPEIEPTVEPEEEPEAAEAAEEANDGAADGGNPEDFCGGC